MKIFLTGCTGFLGQKVAEALIKEGHTVKALIRNENDCKKITAIGAVPIISKLENFSEDILSGIDVVYHFAAIRYEFGFSQQAYETVNVEATEKLLYSATKNKVGKFIFCSTVFVHGHPKNIPTNENAPYAPESLYAESKVLAEKLVRKYAQEKNLNALIIRPTIVYGPGDEHGMLFKLCRLIKDRKFVTIGSGKNLLHLTYIEDIVQGFLQALQKGKPGEAYILASPNPISQNELTAIVAGELNKKIWPIKFPLWLANVVGFIFEIIFSTGKKLGLNYFSREPILTRSKISIMTGNQFFDSTKAQQELNFKPVTDYKEGVRQTLKWYKDNNHV